MSKNTAVFDKSNEYLTKYNSYIIKFITPCTDTDFVGPPLYLEEEEKPVFIPKMQ